MILFYICKMSYKLPVLKIIHEVRLHVRKQLHLLLTSNRLRQLVLVADITVTSAAPLS